MEVMSHSLLTKLTSAWSLTPALHFGQLVESVENVGWDLLERAQQQRAYAPRLAQMGDTIFEAALDAWIAMPEMRKAVRL